MEETIVIKNAGKPSVKLTVKVFDGSCPDAFHYITVLLGQYEYGDKDDNKCDRSDITTNPSFYFCHDNQSPCSLYHYTVVLSK